MASHKELELATLGGGCFWCTEAVFQRLRGVDNVVSGYSGGSTERPTYEAVCNGTTGHAEVIQIAFDPTAVSFADILDVFFHTHDPTTLNRQGNDVGSQYRSAIFYHNEEQKRVAEETIRAMATDYRQPIVTEITPFSAFYPAESYHQDFFNRNPRQGYCQFVVSPKVDKFQQKYADRLKA